IDNRIQLRRADSSLLLERRKSDLSSTTPLIGEESSSSPKRQTLTEKLLHRHHDGRGKEDMRHESILDKEFISGSDFHVPMTPSQARSGPYHGEKGRSIGAKMRRWGHMGPRGSTHRACFRTGRAL
ncbi:MAG: hypothetical protein SGPRY_003575, partial [Prymnesium sp.]